MFLMDEENHLTDVAGVPPDYFSADGQLWGNPLYDWAEMEKDGFSWWKERLSFALELFDGVRIDHFRGFESFWAVKGTEKTAKNPISDILLPANIIDNLDNSAAPIASRTILIITPLFVDNSPNSLSPTILNILLNTSVESPCINSLKSSPKLSSCSSLDNNLSISLKS